MLTKQEKLIELDGASTAYGAMRSLKDFPQNKKIILERLLAHFASIGISEQEWWNYLYNPDNAFLLDPDDPPYKEL
jgi:hypothetical protein